MFWENVADDFRQISLALFSRTRACLRVGTASVRWWRVTCEWQVAVNRIVQVPVVWICTVNVRIVNTIFLWVLLKFIFGLMYECCCCIMLLLLLLRFCRKCEKLLLLLMLSSVLSRRCPAVFAIEVVEAVEVPNRLVALLLLLFLLLLLLFRLLFVLLL